MSNHVTLHRVGQIRGRRGIVLVFVVVLLVLLAIMGTAYLAVSRMDRQGITSRGTLTGLTSPRLNDSGLLNVLAAGAERSVKNELIKDLFNVGKVELPIGTGRIVDGFEAMQNGTLDAPSSINRFRQQFAVDDMPSDLVTNYVQTYEDYDSPGRADPFLASLLPEKRDLNNPTANGAVVWPWISGLVNGSLTSVARPEAFFSDPRYISQAGVFAVNDQYGVPSAAAIPPAAAGDDILERRDVEVGAIPMLRSDSNIAQSDNTRVYPGFRIRRPSGNTSKFFIAGDADGDGIADSGLIPIALNPNATGQDRYVDRRNGVVYFMSYRVVDNSAQINVNTALSVNGDFANLTVNQNTNELFSTNGESRNQLRINQVDFPNLGMFRSNIGLIELVQNSLWLSSTSSDLFGNQLTSVGTSMSAMYRETRSLIDARLPALNERPGGTSAPDTIKRMLRNRSEPPIVVRYGTSTRNASAAALADYEFRSIGDLLENQVASRAGSVGSLATQTSNTVFATLPNGVVSLSAADAVSFAYKGGSLLNPNIAVGKGEDGLLMSSRLSAPNFSANGAAMWQWFPANEVENWFNWSKNFDVNRTAGANYGEIDVLDAARNSTNRFFNFNAPAGSGLADVRLPRTIRSLLTSRNGVTATVPTRTTLELLSKTVLGNTVTKTRTIMPAGMPTYTDIPSTGTYLPIPAYKASAATSTKEELWRGFWSAMTTSSTLIDLSPDETPDPADADNAFRVDKRAYWLADRFDGSSPLTRDYDAATSYTYDAFKSPDRHPSTLVTRAIATDDYTNATQYNRLTERQMTLIRSAIAACNTVDLRDADQDITAMTIDLGPSADGVTTPVMMARVYGNEKQLVITGMVIDDVDARLNVDGLLAVPTVCVELYNPSNEPIELRSYVLGSMDRSTSVAATTLADGVVTGSLAAPAVRLDNQATPTITVLPGDTVVLTNVPKAAAIASGLVQTDLPARPSPGKVTIIGSDDAARGAALTLVLNDCLLPNHELGLFRTRRADGVAYLETPNVKDAPTPPPGQPAYDEYHRPRFSEVETTPDVFDVRTLVPMDAIDTRSLILTEGTPADPSPLPIRYYYLRQTAPPSLTAETAQAWKCFYAGRMYNVRYDDLTAPNTPAAAAPISPTPTIAATTDYAWNRYATGAGQPIPVLNPPEIVLGNPHTGLATGALNPLVPEPFRAPTIPLQNFTPSIAAGPVQHPVNRFPYGSPFARNGDLQSIPFIGSYKIYRITVAGTERDPSKRTFGDVGEYDGAPELYEYVPITMDAVNVAPNPAFCVDDPSVGKLDPSVATPAHQYTNQWASDLLDFVNARQVPNHFRWPNVPATQLQGTGIAKNDPTVPLTDQDGPVQGTEANDPANANVSPLAKWTYWVNMNTGGLTSASRESDDLKQVGTLIQGTLNPNTAPPINMRMLPLAVDPLTGYANINAAVATEQRTRVADLNKKLYDPVAASGMQTASTLNPPYGYDSVFSVGETLPKITAGANDDLMRLGLLNSSYRPPMVNDLMASNLNTNRISNLVSTRSDVFTVYVTVQAWTFVADAPGGNQLRDTRLIGEKRSSFIIDRSAISGYNYLPENLTVLPIDQE